MRSDEAATKSFRLFVSKLLGPVGVAANAITTLTSLRDHIGRAGRLSLSVAAVAMAVAWAVYIWLPSVTALLVPQRLKDRIHVWQRVASILLVAIAGVLWWCAAQVAPPRVSLEVSRTECSVQSRDTRTIDRVLLSISEHGVDPTTGAGAVAGMPAVIQGQTKSLGGPRKEEFSVKPGSVVAVQYADREGRGSLCVHACAVPEQGVAAVDDVRCIVLLECRAILEVEGAQFQIERYGVQKRPQCRFSPLEAFFEKVRVQDGPWKLKWRDEHVSHAFQVLLLTQSTRDEVRGEIERERETFGMRRIR